MSKARAITLRDKDGRPFTPPLFSHVYQLSTEFQQNDKGSWFKWVVKFDGDKAADARLEEGDELFEEAKNFRMALQAGKMKEKYETQAREGSGSRDDDESGDVF